MSRRDSGMKREEPRTKRTGDFGMRNDYLSASGGAAPALAPESRTLEEVEIIRRAAEIIGPDRLPEWMRSPVKALRGRTPYSLMNSPEGRAAVSDVRTRIEHGVY